MNGETGDLEFYDNAQSVRPRKAMLAETFASFNVRWNACSLLATHGCCLVIAWGDAFVWQVHQITIVANNGDVVKLMAPQQETVIGGLQGTIRQCMPTGSESLFLDAWIWRCRNVGEPRADVENRKFVR